MEYVTYWLKLCRIRPNMAYVWHTVRDVTCIRSDIALYKVCFSSFSFFPPSRYYYFIIIYIIVHWLRFNKKLTLKNNKFQDTVYLCTAALPIVTTRPFLSFFGKCRRNLRGAPIAALHILLSYTPFHSPATIPFASFHSIRRFPFHSPITILFAGFHSIHRFPFHSPATIPFAGIHSIHRFPFHSPATIPFASFHSVHRFPFHAPATIPFTDFLSEERQLC